MVEKIVESDEVELSFDVRIFGEMAAGQRFLGSERLFYTVNIAEGWEYGFKVEPDVS